MSVDDTNGYKPADPWDKQRKAAERQMYMDNLTEAANVDRKRNAKLQALGGGWKVAMEQGLRDEQKAINAVDAFNSAFEPSGGGSSEPTIMGGSTNPYGNATYDTANASPAGQAFRAEQNKQRTGLGIQGYNDGGLVQRLRDKFMGTDTGKAISNRNRMLDNAGADPVAQPVKVSAPVTSSDPETQRLLDKYKHMKDGGKVKGKGGPTDDKIPAMLSNGEYVLPADTTKKLGIAKLDKLVKATHKPVKSNGAGHYANGGEEERKPAYNPYEKASIGGMVDAAKNVVSPLMPTPGSGMNTISAGNLFEPGGLARGISDVSIIKTSPPKQDYGNEGRSVHSVIGVQKSPPIDQPATQQQTVTTPTTPAQSTVSAPTVTPPTQPAAPVVVSRSQAADANMAGQGDLNQKMLALQANRPKDSNGFSSGDFSAGEMDAINAGIRARNAQPNRDAASNMDFAAQGMGITRKGNSYSDATNPYVATTFNNGKTGAQMTEANKVPWEQRPENRQNHLDALARAAKDKENLDATIQDRLATEAGRVKGPQAEAEMRNVNRKLGIAGLDAETQRTSRDAQAGLYGTQTEQAKMGIGQQKRMDDLFSKYDDPATSDAERIKIADKIRLMKGTEKKDNMPQYMEAYSNIAKAYANDTSQSKPPMLSFPEFMAQINGGKSQSAMNDLPNPKDHSGKVVRDTQSGKQLKSNGKEWIEVK